MSFLSRHRQMAFHRGDLPPTLGHTSNIQNSASWGSLLRSPNEPALWNGSAGGQGQRSGGARSRSCAPSFLATALARETEDHDHG